VVSEVQSSRSGHTEKVTVPADGLWTPSTSLWDILYQRRSCCRDASLLATHQLGAKGMGRLVLFVAGTPVLAALNPLFWVTMALWHARRPQVIHQLFPTPLFYVGLVSFLVGNFMIAYTSLLTVKILGRERLIGATLAVPIYWVMMALAAAKALWQLVTTPSLWEKTVRGLEPPTST
jgi:glycosyltransferase XagB